MATNSGAPTIDADQEQPAAAVDHGASGSHPKDKPGKHATTRRKKVLVISTVMVVVISCAYFAWNAFGYEDTDDAQVETPSVPTAIPSVNS
jgi:hypothetical protein